MQQLDFPKVLHKIHLGTLVFSPSYQTRFPSIFRCTQNNAIANTAGERLLLRDCLIHLNTQHAGGVIKA